MRLPLEHIPVDLPTSTQIFSLLNCTISEKKNKHVYFNINCCCEEIIPSKKKKGKKLWREKWIYLELLWKRVGKIGGEGMKADMDIVGSFEKVIEWIVVPSDPHDKQVVSK